MAQYSGPSNPATFAPLNAPSILIAPDKTAQDLALIFGERAVGQDVQVNVGDGWELVDSRYSLRNGRFVYPYVLQSGVNTIRFRSVDYEDNVSDEVQHQIERVTRNAVRYRDAALWINSESTPIKFIAGEPDINQDRRDGILQMRFRVKAAGSTPAPVLEFGDVIRYQLNDGLTTRTFEAPVVSGQVALNNQGEEIQEVLAQSTSDALPRLTFTGTIRGESNGAVMERLAIAAGYEKANLFIPEGSRYVGPRTVEDLKVYDAIIKELVFIESWSYPIQWDDNTLVVLPPEVNRFVSWTFRDSQIISLSRSFDGAFIFNRARLVYEDIEDDLNINYLVEDKAPDKSGVVDPEFKFYQSDLYDREALDISPDSVLFFAAAGSTAQKTGVIGSTELDWSDIRTARVILKFNNTSDQARNNTGGSLLKYTVDLDVLPEKKVAVGYFDLRPNHLPSFVPVFYQWMIVDGSGNWIGNTPGFSRLSLKGETAANFEQLITKFGVQMTEVEVLASFSGSWTITAPEDGPTAGEGGVFFARYDQTNDQVRYEYFIEVDVNDAVWQTMYFDLDRGQTVGLAVGSNPADPAHLLNAEVVTDGNQLFNGNRWVAGIKPHAPNRPVRRADKILLKFVSDVRIGDTISIGFNVYGRRFLGAASGIEDPRNINVEYTNTDSVDARIVAGHTPALIDAGAILSGYVSSVDQATRKIRRVVIAASDPIVEEELEVQGYAEMREGQLIRVFSERAGQAYNSYYFVKEVNPAGTANQIKAVRARKVIVDPSTGYTEPYAPDLSFGLSDLIANLGKEPIGFQLGTVQAQKYRGMYRVKLDSGEEIRHVLSRVTPVHADDKVAVVQTPSGSWVIIQVIQPSLSYVEFEEFMAPDEELEEEWQSAIEEGDLTGEGVEDPNPLAEEIPQPGRPLGPVVTLEAVTPSQERNGLIPYRNVYFDLTLSHDFHATATPTAGAVSQGTNGNITNFLFLEVAGSPLSFTALRIAERVFRIRPRRNLPFGESVRVGLAPISSSHPRYPSYVGPERFAVSKLERATLEDEWSREYAIQPELEGEVVEVGLGYVVVEWNQEMNADSVLDPLNYSTERVINHGG